MPEDTEPICERCIWNLDHEGLTRTGPCNRFTWAGSVQRELAEFGTSPDLSGDPGPFPAYPRCAALMMIKDEADIIFANLAWLYHVGVRRLVVLDNMSTDGTHGELKRFALARPDAQMMVLHDGIVAHYQAEKITGIAQVARQMWPDLDWLIPLDADEFCVPRHGLQALAYVPDDIDALTIPKTVHFLRAECESSEANPLARMNVRSLLFVVPPKVFFRAKADLGVEQGNHKARAADGRAIHYTGGFQYGFFHREFQTRSLAQFVAKIRNGGAAILAARAEGRDVGGEHWMDWHRLLSEQGELALQARFEVECFRRPENGYVLDRFSGAPA